MLLIFTLVLPVMGLSNNKMSNNNFEILNENMSPHKVQGLFLENDSDWDYWTNPPNLYLIPSGNMGVGTNNPQAKIDVEENNAGAATIGSSTNTATGKCAIALGSGTSATQNYSIAMGHFSTASGATSTAMGWGTTASGSCSTSMGEGTTASGSFSTAMGRSITVNGDYSVGIGLDSTANTVESSNVVSIMGGKVGIGITNPIYALDILDENEIVARFSGRVIGTDAVNDDEFVTKSQVENIVSSIVYTPTGTDDPHGETGDFACDDDYFYFKTKDGWKRAALESWYPQDEQIEVNNQ